MRTCPHCAEDVRELARVCPHCGRDLQTSPVSPRLYRVLVTSVVTLLLLYMTGCIAYGVYVGYRASMPP